MDGTLEFDSNQYYQWPCECPDFFSGDSCEFNERGCDQASDPCPPTSVCVNNASVPIGYVCAECQEGYSLTGTAMKCMGKCMTEIQGNVSLTVSLINRYISPISAYPLLVFRLEQYTTTPY